MSQNLTALQNDSKLIGGETTYLLSIPYRTVSAAERTRDGNFHLEFTPHVQSTPVSLSNEEVISRFSRHKIPGDSSFLPEKMEIRDRSTGKQKDDPRRLFLLGKGRIHYKILKFAGSQPMKEQKDKDISMS